MSGRRNPAIATQAAGAVGQRETSAPQRIARKGLAAQLARHIAQTAARLVTKGAGCQHKRCQKGKQQAIFVHKAAKAFSGIIDIFTPIRRLT